MIPSYVNGKSWNQTPKVDKDFFRASERFGGTLDLREPNKDTGLKTQGRRVTRALCIRPLNIFNDIVSQLNGRSSKLSQFNAQIKYGYIRNRIPNAFCWKQAQTTYLGVTSGLVQFIYGFTSHLLSFNEFLPQRLDGAADEEKGKIFLLKEGLDFDALLNWKEGAELIFANYRRPKSQDRQLFAVYITHLAILFVYLHELGHAYYSHNEFLSKIAGSSIIKEMQNEKKSSSKLAYILNRFELLADGFAIDLSLNTRLGAFSSGVEDESDYYSWSVGVDLLLWVFAQKLLLTMQQGSHPHPQIRVMNKMSQLHKTDYGRPSKKITYGNQSDMSISNICNLASLDVYDFWRINNLPGWNNSFISEETVKAHVDLIEKIQIQETELWLQYEEYVDKERLGEVKIFRPS